MKTAKILALSTLVALGSAPAHAITLTGMGGLAFPSGDAYTNAEKPSIAYGGELTFGLDMLQLGAFYEHTGIKAPTGFSDFAVNSYGAVGRVSPPGTDLFADARVGLAKSDLNGTDSTFTFGVGVGFQIGLAPFVSLSPRVGYRHLPLKATGGLESVSGSVIDTQVLLSFGF